MHFQPITQGDITGYQVYYNGTMMNVNSSTTTLTFTAPSLPYGVFTDTVIVVVTATSRYGILPASEPKAAIINGNMPLLVANVLSLLVMCNNRKCLENIVGK